MNKTFWLALVTILGLIAPSVVTALPFGASSGNLSASADFTVSGTTLTVKLTNTSTFDVMAPSDVLTAVFFDIPGVGPLTPVSASLNGSTVFFGPSNGGDVGGEWAYVAGLSGAPLGATEGISSSGFGLFGPTNRFNTASNLQGPNDPDGLQYGLTSAGDNTATGNAAVTGGNALILNSVVFTLIGGFPNGFDLSTNGAITNVSFQYGTGLNEPNLPVPEPATMFLLGSGLIGIGVYARRRFKK